MWLRSSPVGAPGERTVVGRWCSAVGHFIPAACFVLVSLTFAQGAGLAEPLAGYDALSSVPSSFVPSGISPPWSRMAQAPRSFRINAPTVYAGFLIPNRNLHAQFFTVESAGTAVAGLEYADHRYPQRGIWAGVYETIEFSAPADMELVLQCWGMLPGSDSASTRYRFSGNVHESGVTWKCTSTVYTLDASLLFSWDRTRPEFSQINGVRYDHYSRGFSDPQHVPVDVVPWPASSNDTVEVEVNTWYPYLGVQMCAAYSDSVAFMRIVGAPIILGSMTYNEYWRGGVGQRVGSTFVIRKGLFADFLASYQKHLSDSMSLGFFLKMDHVSAYGSGDLNVTPGPAQSAPYRLTYRQLNYIFGANFAVRFNIPSLTGM